MRYIRREFKLSPRDQHKQQQACRAESSAMKIDAAAKIAFEHLYKNGVTSPSFFVNYLKLKLRTVHEFKKRMRERGTLKRKERNGKRKMTDADETKLVAIALKHFFWPSKAIATEAVKLGLPKISGSTVLRIFKRRKLLKELPRVTTDLKPHHMATRLKWCLKHRHIATDWRRIVFTDESRFVRNRNKCKRWGFTRQTVMKRQYEQSLMCWGGISFRGKTTLGFIKGNMNSEIYMNTLEDHLIGPLDSLYRSRTRQWVLQQDKCALCLHCAL